MEATINHYSEEDQKLINAIISKFGPTDLWKISDILRAEAMNDIESAFLQLAEDEEKEMLLASMK